MTKHFKPDTIQLNKQARRKNKLGPEKILQPCQFKIYMDLRIMEQADLLKTKQEGLFLLFSTSKTREPC